MGKTQRIGRTVAESESPNYAEVDDFDGGALRVHYFAHPGADVVRGPSLRRLRAWDKPFRERITGARHQPHTTIEGGGHFLQEDRPSELAAVIDGGIAAIPTPGVE